MNHLDVSEIRTVGVAGAGLKGHGIDQIIRQRDKALLRLTDVVNALAREQKK
jgi:hypothetical protein